MIKFCPACKGTLIATDHDDVYECKDCSNSFEIVPDEDPDEEDSPDEEEDDDEEEEEEEEDQR